ncbi:hypothetical protein HZF05_17155 [Sphingomonas sp. CGMCC 1.13654]|uniref:Uncharacterized protein n=1 Tax=Sphingomonas chungangi TaxID=2683589 RepID=A0A838LA98_9SPHN|nr:hypothetical protein [Sphingomonas chungangi]MBA2935810.1 hypothetical protein [Sphingomonas chungangi]MVW54501.1 hypothetical protein [Sphingomonas chungangi]
MIRRVARFAALGAVAVDGAGAWLDWQQDGRPLSLRWAALATAIALVPCALAFLAAVAKRLRQPAGSQGPIRTVDTIRLPLVVPRGYVGAAVLGGIATLAAMGERFGLYIFFAGVALIALALSQARPRAPIGRLNRA